MATQYTEEEQIRDIELSAQADRVEFYFQPTRREFVQLLGAGLVIAACSTALGQNPAGGGGGRRGAGGGGIGGTPPTNLLARLHIGKDGMITVLCGKVECGQGLRTEVTQAAAEELRVPISQVAVVLADTSLVPNDGATVGSQSTPGTIPGIRRAAAGARALLVGLAATQWNVPAAQLTVADGRVTDPASKKELSYADLAGAQDVEGALRAARIGNIALTDVSQWKVLGTPVLRPNARDVVMGKHPYPSDIQRPGMLYGKVLRDPTYAATRQKIDTTDAKAMESVKVVEDTNFVGVAAPSTVLAQKAIDSIARSSKWQSGNHPASKTLAEYLVKNARNVPPNPYGTQMAAAAKALKASYYIPYVQHAPMEPRSAAAEWTADGKLTVWTGTQMPFGALSELANTFRISTDNIRVIVNDFGGGFGGKHTHEVTIEAARLAKGAGKPVSLRWTREEEFTWAYFRPAGVMQAEASLDAKGMITSWYFMNINSGPSAVQTPYNIANNLCQSVPSQKPLREGSYRGLAATANAFARECFMEELAVAAGKDSVDFRVAHLTDARVRDVLTMVAKRFDWTKRAANPDKNVGVGIACATEKGGCVATAAEILLDRPNATFKIQHIAHVYECGAIMNPNYLMSQVQGAVIQGLGPILREGMVFEDGLMQNGTFMDYLVPRFADVPPLDVFLLNRPDLQSAGAGETPLISVAPAICNAVSKALGARIRELPIVIPAA